MKNKKYWVYVHTFPNGKKYVGLTTRENVKDRGKNGKGYNNQQIMRRAIMKYGGDNISHQVFECQTESEMKYLEKYLIAYYQTRDKKYGYNLAEGGQNGPKGVPAKHRKAIDQYSKDGQFIKTWESISAIGETLNYSTFHIWECINKHRPTAYNFYWFHSGETPVFKTKGTRRKIYQFSLNGELIAEFENASEAGRSLGRPDGSHISSCCNKKYKTAYGYIGSYENNLPTKAL